MSSHNRESFRFTSILLTATTVAVLVAVRSAAGQGTAVAAASGNAVLPAATLRLDLEKTGKPVSPALYGLMTEEINYSYDGGLYAELVANRAFHAGWDQPAHWYLMQYGNAQAAMAIDTKTLVNPNRTASLKLTITHADETSAAGVENEGYWGIPVRPQTRYRCSFYAKGDSSAGQVVTVRLVSDRTGEAVAQGATRALDSSWQKYELELSTGSVQPSVEYHLVLTVTRPGTVWFDLVSLFPPTYKDRANGNRIDLMEKLAAMKPAFLRFPGGNYLEGDHIAERFDWKKTIGPLVDRPTHPSPWHYLSSDGMGLLEFLEWCEDLNMQPVLAVYAGYSLQQERIKPGADLEPYVQSALEEIEYVTGGAQTKWGAERVKNGHPAPFPLRYIEVGNEDEFDKSGSYDARFAQFYRAIKARYPQLQVIATTRVSSIRPDLLDDHYYKRAEQFFEFVHHYDQADRSGPKIFVGEWATREGTPTPNFGAALGDAAWMTAMERNSDLIVMASYAPLFVNVNPGGMQWATDLIGYDALRSYGSPGYYAQVMFSNHLGTEIVDAQANGGGARWFYSATRDRNKGVLILKLVNASSAPQPLTIQMNGASSLGNEAHVVSLRAHGTAETNTIEDPERLVPRTEVLPGIKPSFETRLPPYSIQVLEIPVH